MSWQRRVESMPRRSHAGVRTRVQTVTPGFPGVPCDPGINLISRLQRRRLIASTPPSSNLVSTPHLKNPTRRPTRLSQNAAPMPAAESVPSLSCQGAAFEIHLLHLDLAPPRHVLILLKCASPTYPLGPSGLATTPQQQRHCFSLLHRLPPWPPLQISTPRVWLLISRGLTLSCGPSSSTRSAPTRSSWK